MTCKEKIDGIEKILDDEYETKIERIREIVEDAEDKAIPLDKVKQTRKGIDDLIYVESYVDPYCVIEDVLELVDKMLSEVENE